MRKQSLIVFYLWWVWAERFPSLYVSSDFKPESENVSLSLKMCVSVLVYPQDGNKAGKTLLRL